MLGLKLNHVSKKAPQYGWIGHIDCWPLLQPSSWYPLTMMTSSNGNIFRVTGPLCGEFTGPGEFHAQRPVTRSFDVFSDLRLNKQLSKQPWGWWFETPLWSLWRHCNNICPCQVSVIHFEDRAPVSIKSTRTLPLHTMTWIEYRTWLHTSWLDISIGLGFIWVDLTSV